MFQHIRESWFGQNTALTENDFIDLGKAARLLGSSRVDVAKPPGRWSTLVLERGRKDRQHPSEIDEDEIPIHLWNVIAYDQLYLDPCFEDLAVDNEQVSDLFKLAKRARQLDRGEHLWLNRNFANA
jgi:hypothetical protein